MSNLYIEIDGKEIMMWSGYYKCYTAAYCRTTGRPMLNKKEYEQYSNRWLSTTRCKKIGQDVKEGEEPVAFYRVKNGYCALYERGNCNE